jgi:hypothetical protein
MALSPNYNWSEPDNSSLVKDGAQAMRTLGDAIDTTMATKAVNSNPVINSAMQVWARGTSFAVAPGSAFTADRYNYYSGVSGRTISRQVTGDTTNLPNIQYCSRQQRDSGNTNTSPMAFGQSLETINSIPYAGKTITFSFYARAGANYSPTSMGLDFQISSGTGTDQNIVSTGYTGAVLIANGTATLTTTWQRFTYTGSVPSTATELGFFFQSNPTGTAGANDYYDLTGIQIDIGSVALPFQTASGGSIQGELAMCQRYYETMSFRMRGSNASTDVNAINFAVTKRVVPTSTIVISSGTTATITDSFLQGLGIGVTGALYDTYATTNSSAEL